MLLKIPEYVTWFPHGGSVVLIDKRDGKRSELNDAGAYLWTCLGRGIPHAELMERLTRRAEVDRTEARSFIEAWVGSLEQARLLYVRPSEEAR